ncbi:MAG: hypothetical protein KAQ97_09280 [Candidatus Fermentibacteraceae bacterium]|nr:hypothetical protein [Candidatus Fermentibacteraceae bacterium]
MAHRTRKRLTKTELKKDPINDGIVNSIAYLQEHIKQFIIGTIILVVLVLVVQSVLHNADRQADEAFAQYYLAGQLYDMGMNSFRYGQFEFAINQFQTARQIASNNFRAYPGRSSGKRSAILAAKIGIMLGLESEVIPTLQSFIASNPGVEYENSASLHLAIALENRGGESDLVIAQEMFTEILEITPANSQLAWESNYGLSRIFFRQNDYETSRRYLHSALEISQDTTDFMYYQLARLDILEN